MNKRYITSSPVTILAAAILLATATSGVQAQGASGEFSLGAQGVFVTSDKDSSSNSHMGEDVGGVVGYAGVFAPLQGGSGIYGDLTFDYHGSTADNDTGDDEDHAMYGAIGLHYVFDAANPNTWGIFGLVAGGNSNAEDDPAGPVWGLGAEKRFGDVYLQGGYMEHFGTNDSTDTLEDMWFARVGGERKFANGMLSGSLALGFGDFDEDSGGGSNDDDGEWVQISLTYDAPLGNSGINWYAGYQGDWVSVDECCGIQTEEGFFHSVQLGIKIPFGGNKTPFKTPNFRVPLTNAGHLN